MGFFVTLKQGPWVLECSLTFHSTSDEKIRHQQCPICLHMDDVDIMDNEKEMAKKVEELDGRNKRKSGTKTKEDTSHATIVAPIPSPFSQK